MPTFFHARYLLTGFVYIIVFLISIYLISHQLSGIGYLSDTIVHLSFVNKYFNGEIYIPHPLWHYCVHYMSYITLDDKMATSLVTSFFIIIWVFIVHTLLKYFLYDLKEKKINLYFILILLLALFVIGPAHFSSFNTNIYLGIGSPNIWHNVTMFAVKPFALLVTFFFIVTLQSQGKIKYQILTIVFFILSMYAKPSFAVMFIPALIVYVLLIKPSIDKRLILFALMLLSIFLLILFSQFLHTYGDENALLAFGAPKAKIIIDFFGPWSHYTPNIFISIMLATCFPIVFLFLNFHTLKKEKSLHTELLLFSWVMLIISIIIFSIFAEEGSRYYHLNFGWSYNLALSILYVFSIISYFSIYEKIKSISKSILNIILCIQIITGIYYLYTILIGGTYH